MERILDKYNDNVIRNIKTDNIVKICDFLNSKNCEFVTDLLDDYLDLFMIDYEEFVVKFDKINAKYNYNFLSLAKEDMNLIEEFFYD